MLNVNPLPKKLTLLLLHFTAFVVGFYVSIQLKNLPDYVKDLVIIMY